MDELQETAKREKCPLCGCSHMVNNHYIQHQRHDRVFVECAECGHLVAKYILRNYLDPGFAYEQFLKLAKIHQDFSSGRKAMDNFQTLQKKVQTQFEEIKNLLKKGNHEDELTLQSLLAKYQVLEDSYQPFDE